MSRTGNLGRPAEILLVDDNPDDVQLAKIALDDIDIPHQLHVARDGQEAIDFLQQAEGFADKPRPDLILLDLNMPVKDGRAVLKEVKEDSVLRRIPVLILTTSDSAVDRLVAYSQHANAYLVKPLGLDQWLEMLSVTTKFWLQQVHLAPMGGTSAS